MALGSRFKQVILPVERRVFYTLAAILCITVSSFVWLCFYFPQIPILHSVHGVLICITVGMLSFQIGKFTIRYKMLFGPGHEIEKILRKVECGDYRQRISSVQNDLHFEHLAVTLNTMLDHVEQFKKAVVRQASRLCKDNRMLKEHNADLEDFLKIITHDLKAPLSTIEMLCDLLLETKDPDKEKVTENLCVMEQNVGHLRKLVDDLLEYSLIGTRDDEHENVDIPALLDEVLETFLPQIQQAGAKIVIRDSLPSIAGSYAQLTHVFTNLITNALKYRSEEPPEIYIAGEKEAGCVHFTVQDNGSGIMPELCGKIFSVCFRGNTAAAPKGTGIGLSIVEKIVKNHGGRVWAESKGINQGAVFHIILPASDTI